MDLKNPGNIIYLIGVTKNELGCSIYSKIKNIKNGIVPDLDVKVSKKLMKTIFNAINEGLFESCHDCSDGGFVTAISEMAFAGDKGVNINIDAIKTSEKMTVSETLFSESNTRFIVEVSPENVGKFEKLFKGIIISKIGEVSNDKNLKLESKKSKIFVKENIKNLQKAWQKTLQW